LVIHTKLWILKRKKVTKKEKVIIVAYLLINRQYKSKGHKDVAMKSKSW
ncbi:MAG: hypothetical protein JWP81_1226, partial [Ferruginibacter sp.]|nr:hypothetical protein [Ferruginibacter sp.]